MVWVVFACCVIGLLLRCVLGCLVVVCLTLCGGLTAWVVWFVVDCLGFRGGSWVWIPVLDAVCVVWILFVCLVWGCFTL